MVTHLRESAEEVKRSGYTEVEGQCGEHQAFHSQDIIVGVSIVATEGQLLDLGCIDLLVLAGEQHGSHTDKLEQMFPLCPRFMGEPLCWTLSLDTTRQGFRYLTRKLRFHMIQFPPPRGCWLYRMSLSSSSCSDTLQSPPKYCPSPTSPLLTVFSGAACKSTSKVDVVASD